MAAEALKYRYGVDASDVIVWVNNAWLAFAQENGAAGLSRSFVLKRSLWDFVAGEELRRLYMEIHARVRSTGVPAILPFRCDSASLQRHMRLTITREDAGQLAYESILVRTVPQRPLDVLNAERPRSTAFLTICSCCKRALLEPRGWLDLEEVCLRLRIFEAQEVPQLRHTVCHECANILSSAADNGGASPCATT